MVLVNQFECFLYMICSVVVKKNCVIYAKSDNAKGLSLLVSNCFVGNEFLICDDYVTIDN